MLDAEWMPRPWKAELVGCIWLPRMLDKGRRAIEGEQQGRDLMNGYLFGNASPADRMLLRFLRTDAARVRALLNEFNDDNSVAEALLRESGRSPLDIRTWNMCFRTLNAPFILLLESDERQRHSGMATTFYKFLYNRVVMPPVYLLFGRTDRPERPF